MKTVTMELDSLVIFPIASISIIGVKATTPLLIFHLCEFTVSTRSVILEIHFLLKDL